MQEAHDFLAESEQLYRLIKPLGGRELDTPTDFRDWTINDVVAHLYYLNVMVSFALTDEAAFDQFMGELKAFKAQGGSQRSFAKNWLGSLWGEALRERWWEQCEKVSREFAATDPVARIKWAGPSMSARSSVSARLMETWAHGQAVFDILGTVRQNTDRIRAIVVLGNNTFGWTFTNRGEAVPEKKPFLSLVAPSGADWVFNEPGGTEFIRGSAEGFCQVVTQVRNVADTDLFVVGEVARAWMDKAQCFAGDPEQPPLPGLRRMRII